MDFMKMAPKPSSNVANKKDDIRGAERSNNILRGKLRKGEKSAKRVRLKFLMQ